MTSRSGQHLNPINVPNRRLSWHQWPRASSRRPCRRGAGPGAPGSHQEMVEAFVVLWLAYLCISTDEVLCIVPVMVRLWKCGCMSRVG